MRAERGFDSHTQYQFSIPNSSTVEQRAVNSHVVGSNPASGATFIMKEIIREISGALMTVSFMCCYLPQIIKIIRTESSTDLSPWMIILGLSGYIFGTIYMFTNVFGLWWFMNYLTGIVCSTILLYYWYKHK